MGQINTQYTKLRKEFLLKRPMCQAKLHHCSLKSTDVHHMKGRGKYHLDTSTWLSVCRNCHNWIEVHPEEAKELGFSHSRNI
jgi:hypothetical protein